MKSEDNGYEETSEILTLCMKVRLVREKKDYLALMATISKVWIPWSRESSLNGSKNLKETAKKLKRQAKKLSKSLRSVNSVFARLLTIQDCRQKTTC
jgi:hypothetical protein